MKICLVVVSTQVDQEDQHRITIITLEECSTFTDSLAVGLFCKQTN